MAAETDGPTGAPDDPTEHDEAELDAFDLDHDGKISLVEQERARLGVIDARLEEIAEHGGITGKLAEAAHRIVDRLDNDEPAGDEARDDEPAG